MSNSSREKPYGFSDTSFQAAGKESGLRILCKEFYHQMEALPEAQKLHMMHTDSIDLRVEKLTSFLCQWLGGPKFYNERYDGRSMPEVHMGLIIHEEEKDAWLKCMDLAIEKQPFDNEFKEYLKIQFRYPAELFLKISKK